VRKQVWLNLVGRDRTRTVPRTGGGQAYSNEAASGLAHAVANGRAGGGP
jgi:hypothetical protein